jgi:hypothetical protein
MIIKGIRVVSCNKCEKQVTFFFKMLILSANVLRIKKVEDYKLNHKWGEELQQY